MEVTAETRGRDKDLVRPHPPTSGHLRDTGEQEIYKFIRGNAIHAYGLHRFGITE